MVSPTRLGIAYADRRGSVDFWINVLLDFLGWIPGVIHAWYVNFPGFVNERRARINLKCNRYIISHTEGVAR